MIDDEPDRSAWPHRDRRLDLKVALDHLIAGTRHVLLRRLPECLDEVTLPAELKLSADAEHRRKDHALE